LILLPFSCLWPVTRSPPYIGEVRSEDTTITTTGWVSVYSAKAKLPLITILALERANKNCYIMKKVYGR